MPFSIIHGDCIEEMKKLQENSIDSIVTDPPYGIGFMGEKWDKFSSKQFQEFSYNWGVEALRVLKSGSYCLAFSGTRTYHRMVCGLEDAGFKIKDMVMWCYGSGFPKSLNISLAIDKYYGKEREVIDIKRKSPSYKSNKSNTDSSNWKYGESKMDYNQEITQPNTIEAQQWDGWGTALKPALEPVVVAQKLLIGTYAENVLKYGTGGLNVDGCRIDFKNKDDFDKTKVGFKGIKFNGDVYSKSTTQTIQIMDKNKGRFPSNLLLDTESAELLDKQSGNTKSIESLRRKVGSRISDQIYGYATSGYVSKYDVNGGYNDHGGASRFFYCGKAHKSERNAGLLDVIEMARSDNNKMMGSTKDFKLKDGKKRTTKFRNNISTLKPINIMRYLVRLVTPPNGVVLDPFAGSGTTGIACIIEGFNYVLIEKRKRFANLIIPKRLEYWSDPKNWLILKNHNALPKVKNLKKEKENNSILQYMECK